MPKKFWNVDDPLFNSLPRFKSERVKELFKNFETIDAIDGEELILQLLSLCKIILKRQAYKNPAYYRNMPDLIGVLTLRTCIWLDDLKHHFDEKIATQEYYWQIIKHEIHDFNLDDNNPNVSGNWIRKQHRQGKPLATRIKLQDDLLQFNPTEVLDLEDILLTLSETERERELVVLRFQGFTEGEIAEQLGITQQYVHLIRADLEKRYDEYLKSELNF
jgi:hypothetical protein